MKTKSSSNKNQECTITLVFAQKDTGNTRQEITRMLVSAAMERILKEKAEHPQSILDIVKEDENDGHDKD